MKKTFVLILAIAALYSCAVHKNSNLESKHVLFSEYSEYVDGDIILSVINDTKLNCDSNIVIIEISSIKAENTIVAITGGAWSRENQPESHYLLMPSCKHHPYLTVSYRTVDGSSIQLKKIDLMPFMKNTE